MKFYQSLGFEVLRQKAITLAHGVSGNFEVVLMKWGERDHP